MSTSNTDNILVDILSNEFLDKDGKKRFTQAHLDKSKKLINIKAYPEYFGDEIIDGLLLSDNPFQLIDESFIDWDGKKLGNMTQNSRVGGQNPKMKEIKNDISTYGYKLRNIPILVLDNGNGLYTPINGRTRHEILKGYGFDNFICIVYVADNIKTQLEIKDTLSKMGLKTNAENDPAGNLMLEDVYSEGVYAIDNRFINLTGDTDADYLMVLDRINEVCGKGIFTLDKRTAVATRIVNEFATSGRVFSYSVKGQPDNWMRKSKFKNIEAVYDKSGNLIKRGIIYNVVAASTLERSMVNSVAMACNNRDCDVRVIIHTGTLTGYVASHTYVSRIWRFRKDWASLLQDLSFGFFHNANHSKSPISLYGALPAVEKLSDMKKLQRFVSYSSSSLDDLIANEYFDDGLEEV